jgi:hypothetical protein
MNKRLVAGAAICLPALVLGGLFFVESYHEVYRSSPPVFVLITLLGAFCHLAGGLLLGRTLAARREARSGALQRFLFSASGTGYWGHPPHEYEGDYVIPRLQIDLFRFTILPGLIGGLMPGAALRMEKAK